jgi:hypothetical protein
MFRGHVHHTAVHLLNLGTPAVFQILQRGDKRVWSRKCFEHFIENLVNIARRMIGGDGRHTDDGDDLRPVGQVGLHSFVTCEPHDFEHARISRRIIKGEIDDGRWY